MSVIFDNIIFGSAVANELEGTPLSDKITAEAGNDEVVGGLGRDLLFGNTGNDWLAGDQFTGPADGVGDADTIYGGQGEDEIEGNGGDDKLFGQKGHDIIFGDDGNDYIHGGSGDDALLGGLGVDTLVGGIGSDVFVFDPIGIVMDFDNETMEILPEFAEAIYRGTSTDVVRNFNVNQDQMIILGIGDDIELHREVTISANSLEELILQSNVDQAGQVQLVHVSGGALGGHDYLVYNALNASGAIELIGIQGTLTEGNIVDVLGTFV
jgi:Ca2+-binding RTX toxin-like protein